MSYYYNLDLTYTALCVSPMPWSNRCCVLPLRLVIALGRCSRGAAELCGWSWYCGCFGFCVYTFCIDMIVYTLLAVTFAFVNVLPLNVLCYNFVNIRIIFIIYNTFNTYMGLGTIKNFSLPELYDWVCQVTDFYLNYIFKCVEWHFQVC